MNIINEILKHDSLSIIGNYKNVGKTTTLNYILGKVFEKNINIGLTSIGVDGESEDIVTKTKKPRIYVRKNTIIATSKGCVLNSDITKEILEITDINTPLGVVVIFKALSDGYTELAGPSINSQIKYICEKLKSYNVSLSIVDGALSRKSLGSPSITDCTIFCSGAIIDKNIENAIEKISYESKILSIENIKDEKFKDVYKNIKDSKVSIINQDYTYKNIEISTSLNNHKKIYDLIDKNTKYIFINGIVTDNLINGLMKSGDKYKNKVILIKDSTKIFLEKEVYSKFLKLGGNIKTIDKINLVAISINPTSIQGYEFDEKYFIENIKNKTSLEVFNVKGQGW